MRCCCAILWFCYVVLSFCFNTLSFCYSGGKCSCAILLRCCAMIMLFCYVVLSFCFNILSFCYAIPSLCYSGHSLFLSQLYGSVVLLGYFVPICWIVMLFCHSRLTFYRSVMQFCFALLPSCLSWPILNARKLRTSYQSMWWIWLDRSGVWKSRKPE